MREVLKYIIVSFLLLQGGIDSYAQRVPAEEKNIDWLVTFGKNAPPSWGDDDNCQVFYIVINSQRKKPVYIKVFDPNVGGKHDEMYGTSDTQTRFSIYGGKNAYQTKRDGDPEKDYDKGKLLDRKIFGSDQTYDDKFFTFPPLNPEEGQLLGDNYLFKVVVEGQSGDDGNLYYFYISGEEHTNIRVMEAECFAYELTFRLKPGIARLNPKISDGIVLVKTHVFDYDNDGFISVNSPLKIGHRTLVSGDNEWAVSNMKIEPEETGNYLEVQVRSGNRSWKNNVVIFLVNQNEVGIPFYISPIGDPPDFLTHPHGTPKR